MRIDMFISIDGDDQNSGMPDKPIRTIAEAIQRGAHGLYFKHNVVMDEPLPIQIPGLFHIIPSGSFPWTFEIE